MVRDEGVALALERADIAGFGGGGELFPRGGIVAFYYTGGFYGRLFFYGRGRGLGDRHVGGLKGRQAIDKGFFVLLGAQTKGTAHQDCEGG